jgi:uncharacterized OB-fold protein
MSDAYVRPEQRLVPDPTPTSTAFWTGGERGELLIYRCQSCSHWFHPPAEACWRCRSVEVGPQPASGRGTVAAFTINRQPWVPGLEPPYVVAMIALEDEPDTRVMSNVVGVDVEAVHTGMPVEVFFEQWEDVWVPLFRPVQAQAAGARA